LDSSVALLQTASGLEKTMSAPPVGIIKDSSVAQISAFLYYQASVMGRLTSNREFKNLFKKTLFDQIDKDFGEFMDSSARVKPKSLHHVYEWNRTGQKTSRLFKIKRIDADGLSFRIGYDFKLSKTSVPSKNKKQKKKYIFANKASVMEAGMPVIIRPRSAERLVFELDGITVFMPKGSSVTVKSPGGRASSNQFRLHFGRYFGGELVNSSIKNSGFQRIFNPKIAKALSVPVTIKKVQYSFSPGKIRLEADSKLQAAFGGSL
jgi:hypothetical protein